jgi:hypothetical protein
MVSTGLSTEVTGAVRDFGAGVETKGRALGSSVLDLVGAASVTESARARIAQELRLPPAQIRNWIASTLELAACRLGADSRRVDSESAHRGDYVIVDKLLTRC